MYAWLLMYIYNSIVFYVACMYRSFKLFRPVPSYLLYFDTSFIWVPFISLTFQYTISSKDRQRRRERETALANSPMHPLIHRPLRLMLVQMIIPLALMLFLHSHRPRLIRPQINRITIHQLLRRTNNICNQSIQ